MVRTNKNKKSEPESSASSPLTVEVKKVKVSKKKATQPRASKRGANEDSEVRYDTKHVEKKKKLAQESKKKSNKIVEKEDSLDTDTNNDDEASVFSGNEDDKGSVVSALLEEDICYHCGMNTMNGDEWGEVVMCDTCDGEYHLRCQGLSSTPEGSFVCSKCVEDEQHFKDMRFEVSSCFKIPPRPEGERSVVYSPAKPLGLAWEECLGKGLMVVSQVFSKDIMSKLTHGLVQKVLRSGRVAESWLGATKEVAKRVSSTSVQGGLIDRNGRYDLRLPDFVIEELGLVAALQPILTRLEGIMGTPKPQLRTHNVVFVPVGSGVQEWHTDDELKIYKKQRYFTVLVNLNPLDAYCGGTEVWVDKLARGDLVRARPGDALVFPGSLLHRGHANTGYMHRFFYYASFACGADANAGVV